MKKKDLNKKMNIIEKKFIIIYIHMSISLLQENHGH